MARARKKEETAAGEKAEERAPTESERKRFLLSPEGVVLLFLVAENLLFTVGRDFSLPALAQLRFIEVK